MSTSLTHIFPLETAEAQEEVPFPEVARELPSYGRFVDSSARKLDTELAEARAEKVPQERIIARIVSPEARAAMARVESAMVEVYALRKLLELAEGRLDLAQKAVVQAVRDYEDIDPDAEYAISHAHAMILRSALDPVASVLEVCEALLQAESKVLRSVSEGSFPSDWKEAVEAIKGTPAFVSDLAEFLVETADLGKQIVTNILCDPQLAQKATSDEHLPKAVRLLAGISLKVRGDAAR